MTTWSDISDCHLSTEEILGFEIDRLVILASKLFDQGKTDEQILEQMSAERRLPTFQEAWESALRQLGDTDTSRAVAEILGFGCRRQHGTQSRPTPTSKSKPLEQEQEIQAKRKPSLLLLLCETDLGREQTEEHERASENRPAPTPAKRARTPAGDTQHHKATVETKREHTPPATASKPTVKNGSGARTRTAKRSIRPSSLYKKSEGVPSGKQRKRAHSAQKSKPSKNALVLSEEERKITDRKVWLKEDLAFLPAALKPVVRLQKIDARPYLATSPTGSCKKQSDYATLGEFMKASPEEFWEALQWPEEEQITDDSIAADDCDRTDSVSQARRTTHDESSQDLPLCDTAGRLNRVERQSDVEDRDGIGSDGPGSAAMLFYTVSAGPPGLYTEKVADTRLNLYVNNATPERVLASYKRRGGLMFQDDDALPTHESVNRCVIRSERTRRAAMSRYPQGPPETTSWVLPVHTADMYQSDSHQLGVQVPPLHSHRLANTPNILEPSTLLPVAYSALSAQEEISRVAVHDQSVACHAVENLQAVMDEVDAALPTKAR